MRFRRIAGLLFASALAMGLDTGAAAVAHAEIMPIPPESGVYYEIFPPYNNPEHHKCVDVPFGRTTPGTYLQMYHCHGFDSGGAVQLFRFLDVGNGYYWIINKATGLCVSVVPGAPTSFNPAKEDNCSFDANYYWKLIPTAFNPNAFELAFGDLSHCLMLMNNPVQDDTLIYTTFCADPSQQTPYLQEMTWALG